MDNEIKLTLDPTAGISASQAAPAPAAPDPLAAAAAAMTAEIAAQSRPAVPAAQPAPQPAAQPTAQQAGPVIDETMFTEAERRVIDEFSKKIDITDTAVIGEGIVDGRAQESDWWVDPKKIRGATRGHLLFLMRCRGVTVQGLTFRNSPAWNLHPTMSRDLDFLNLQIEAPWDSPNTDGFDPESCSHVRLLGSRISVGDDCIAIKAGKIELGKKYRMPCDEIEIAWCAMLDGHGGVTVGSEMAGGVRNVRAHHCYMRGNDRALRIKTRRGRGKDGVVDNILFEHVRMKNIKVPLVVNSLYFCDPDGHSPWVQSRAHEAVDDTTPRIGSIRFEHVKATGCQGCVAYVLGLPEQPVEELVIRDSYFDFAEDASEVREPAMADGVDPVRKKGLVLKYAGRVELKNLRIDGVEGPMLDLEEVREINQQTEE